MMLNLIQVVTIERGQKVRKIAAIASRYFFLVLSIFLLTMIRASVASAACHVITPSGSGAKNGADWNNAMAGVPSNLVRGDSYYLAAGSYPSFMHGEAASGSTLITIKRAYQADHCTDTGYVDSTMGQPAGQAVFPHFELTSGYWVVDGNYPGRKPTKITDTGFYVDGTNCTASNCWPLNLSQTANTSNITIKNLSIQGGGDAKQSTNIDENIRIMGGSNFFLQYVEVFNSSNTPIVLRGVNGFTLDHSRLEHNIETSVFHGEGISDGGSSNVTISFNTFKDIQGTAVITELNAGTTSTASNWNIYGNLFFYPPGNPEGRNGGDDGLIACINSQTATNWRFYNNTIANMTGISTRLNFSLSSGYCANPTGIVAYNNLWYNSSRADASGPVTQDYNSYIKMTNVTDSGAHSLNVPLGPSPFVGEASDNYHLLADLNVSPMMSMQSLMPGNQVDPDSVTRTTSRGTYQFVSGSSSAPAPPTSLQATVQ